MCRKLQAKSLVSTFICLCTNLYGNVLCIYEFEFDLYDLLKMIHMARCRLYILRNQFRYHIKELNQGMYNSDSVKKTTEDILEISVFFSCV